ncbi:unnamed protein product [Peniophora sp. CBMAI 1063]|nr:unnamed protein product [Peniophora sp. CBMAI 1063]
MAVVDPTYPLLPIAYILSAIMLFFVMLTSTIRKSWNLGVCFLCFWLFFETLTAAINGIVWRDNGDIKLLVYCDIVTRLQEISFVVKPMATLIISRRLHLIANLQSIELPSPAARRRDLAIEWTLGLIVPLIVAGPLYYISQGARFQVLEGFGCSNIEIGSILELVSIQIWTIVPPLISVTVYYPRVARIFYKQSKEFNRFLRTNGSVSRTNYLRILILASIDILLTLPFGLAIFILDIQSDVAGGDVPFYPGWSAVHGDWAPVSVPYAEIQARGKTALTFSFWTSPVLSFVIFGLFGVTTEARASYRRVLYTVLGWCGYKSARHVGPNSTLGTIEFGPRPQETSLGGCDTSFHSSIGLSHQASTIRDVSETRTASGQEDGQEKDIVVKHPEVHANIDA